MFWLSIANPEPSFYRVTIYEHLVGWRLLTPRLKQEPCHPALPWYRFNIRITPMLTCKATLRKQLYTCIWIIHHSREVSLSTQRSLLNQSFKVGIRKIKFLYSYRWAHDWWKTKKGEKLMPFDSRVHAVDGYKSASFCRIEVRRHCSWSNFDLGTCYSGLHA